MNETLATAVAIAREAGALLLSYYDRGIRLEYKGEADIVTEADRASEALIVKRLQAQFPEHAVLAEEGGGHRAESEYRWYVDPLDGTTNFAHGFPMFCVSMGLEKNGEMILGAVYDPLRDEMFTAAKQAGAELNGRPLRVSKVDRLEEALVGTGFPSNKRHKNANIHFYHQISLRTHGVRRAGSAALDLAYVAAGRLDCFWEFNLHPWDLAAGALLVREAGGQVSDMAGRPHRLDAESIAATNGLLHGELQEAFEEIFAGRYRAGLPPVRRPA